MNTLTCTVRHLWRMAGNTEQLPQLTSLYGGMGSINDVVLYENAKPLLDENNELQALLSDLYELCAGNR
ncbi:DUF6966 domain-containing protein [Pseudomonas sp. GM55]|uniref:DUF6966 domain-containing protein n=1 Tax=Pseudomonas sp. GM55 TaxID=1144333 RepID=UPI003FD201A3